MAIVCDFHLAEMCCMQAVRSARTNNGVRIWQRGGQLGELQQREDKANFLIENQQKYTYE